MTNRALLARPGEGLPMIGEQLLVDGTQEGTHAAPCPLEACALLLAIAASLLSHD